MNKNLKKHIKRIEESIDEIYKIARHCVSNPLERYSFEVNKKYFNFVTPYRPFDVEWKKSNSFIITLLKQSILNYLQYKKTKKSFTGDIFKDNRHAVRWQVFESLIDNAFNPLVTPVKFKIVEKQNTESSLQETKSYVPQSHMTTEKLLEDYLTFQSVKHAILLWSYYNPNMPYLKYVTYESIRRSDLCFPKSKSILPLVSN